MSEAGKYYKLLLKWLRANNNERFLATTSYEQNTLRDFAIWLDEQTAVELIAYRNVVALLREVDERVPGLQYEFDYLGQRIHTALQILDDCNKAES